MDVGPGFAAPTSILALMDSIPERDNPMKRFLCGWLPAALLCAAVAPGCAENNESTVTGSQGTTKVEGSSEPPPRSQMDLAKQYQNKGANPYAGQGQYPGAGKNLAKGAAKEAGKDAPKEASK